jgi:hypothetical protein
MHQLILLTIIWGYILCSLSALAQPGLPDRRSQLQSGQIVPHNAVQVKGVVKVFIAKNIPAFLLEYDYDFPEHPTVYIAGLGTVPGKGNFRYFSTGKTLEFRDDKSGALLVEVPLKETVIVAAKPPLNEIPNQAQFPPSFQSFPWETPSSLPEIANTVLGKHFHYLPQQGDSKTFLATTFTPLSLHDVPHGVLGQVALLFSFPYDSSSNKYFFHVQSIVQEGRSHSDEFRPTSNYTIHQAANNFIADLVKEMKMAGGGKTK